MSADNPLVTVYVVNHNYGRYLKQAVESILAQSMQDFEILLIDDGSTDNSREIIEGYRGHGCITPVLQHNKGLTVTNNIALRMARGKFVMRLDADDYLDANALGILSDTLERHPDVGLVFPDYYSVDESGNILELVRRHNFDNVTLLDQPAHGACTMHRREILMELGGYDESFSCQDGYDLWVRLIKRCQVKNINLPLFYYRQHSKSLTRDERRVLDTRSQILRKHALRRDQQLSALAIVPVRGRHGDAIPLALRDLAGQRVVDWTIESALNAERVADVLITSPDEVVLRHVEQQWGSRVITLHRDDRLAQVNTFIDKTVLYALDHYRRSKPAPQAVVVLPIETPFRTSQHIDTALDVMTIFDTDRVVSVRLETATFYQHRGGGLEPLRRARTLALESEGLYSDAGLLHAARTDFLEQSQQMYGGRIGHIVVEQRSALCLTTEWDWEVASHEARRLSAGRPDAPTTAVSLATQSG